MNDVIAAVLGEKQRVLMEALADYNEAVEAALMFAPDRDWRKFYVTDAPSIGAQARAVSFSRRVAVTTDSIKELLVKAIDDQRDVILTYKDSEGERTVRRISPIRWREGRWRSEYALLVARDVEKDDIRHFRLDRIERVEDAA